jgi:hypothetical protein
MTASFLTELNRVINSLVFPWTSILELIFLNPPSSYIDLLFLLYISLKIKIAKFKLYIIPAKYILILTAIIIDSFDL